ncbi:hypothetical protein QGP82_20105 [Leptothoe sp. LEGE 181152]|nr:hypothetical protein [Leptothoe sp. LEGE 181152]
MPEVPSPQNQEALEELCRLLRFSQGEFALILAVCNSTLHRQELISKLRQQCAFPFDEITLAPTATTLFTTVNAYTRNADPDALMVYGLNEVQDSEQLLTATNQIREEFREFSFPLVLWLTDSDLKHIIRTAPDFYTWANSITFETPSSFFLVFIDKFIQNVWQQVTQSQEHRFLTVRDLGFTASSANYQELETSLAALSAHNVQLSPFQTADLEFVRGRIANNNLDIARHHYEHSLKQWKSLIAETDHALEWQEKMGHVQFYLGLWWRTHAERHLPDFERALNNACKYFTAAIDTFEIAQQPELAAKYINYLAESLHRLERWSELEIVATKAKSLHQQQQQNTFRLARAGGFLAEVALARGDWAKAQAYAESALRLIQPANLSLKDKQDVDLFNWVNSFHRSWYLFSLGKAQFQQREIDTAVATLEEARSVAHPDYDPRLYSLLLAQLQKGYFQQGLYLPAFETRRQRDAIESRFNYRAFVGAGRLQPKQQMANPALPSDEVFKDVIVASGRKQDVKELVRRLGQDEYVLTIVYGPSGVGKSSLIEAGLVPALERERIETRRVVPVYLRRYRNWVEDLVQTLTDIDAKGDLYSSGILGYVQEGSEEADESVAASSIPPEKVLRRLKHYTQKNQVLVLVFDQFEEFFFEFEQTAERRPFYDFLRSCLTMPYVKVLLSLREDYIHYLLECDRITTLDIIDNNILDKKWLYYIGNFSLEETQSVFKDLTYPTPYNPEDDLIEQVVKDLAAGAGEVRPIELQIVGAQLQTENITTKREYHNWGDPNLSTKELLVQKYLNDVLYECGPRENQQLAELTLYLLTDEKGIRPLKTESDLVDDLRSYGEQKALKRQKINLILKILTKSGLVVEVPEFPQERYQLVHDYLANFMREQKQFLKIERLRDDLARERKERERVENRLSRFFKALMIFGGVVGVAAVVTSIVLAILLVNTRALTRRTKESSIERLLDSSNTFHQTDKGQLMEPLLKSLEAAEIFRQLQWDKPELKARISIELQKSLSEIREINRFGGHSKSVLAVAYSNDGTMIASAGDDGTINIRQKDGRLISSISRAHTKGIRSVAFSPNNERIASASDDQTIKIWDLNGVLLKTLTGHTGAVNSVVFNPDAQMLASASADRTVKLWNVNTGLEVRTMRGHTSWVNSVDFNRDGNLLVSGGSDQTIRLWSSEGEDLGQMAGHGASVNQVVFSPNGQLLASASTDRTVKLWTLDGQLRDSLDGHQAKVWDVSFSADSQFLVSASSDRTIRLWNLQGQQLDAYQSSDAQASFFNVSFSPNENVFVSASADERVSLWDFRAKDRTLISHTETQATSIASANVNGAFISGYRNGTIKFWDGSGSLVSIIQAHNGSITDLSYSSRGDLIVSASNDGTIKLWRNTGELIKEFDGHDSSVSSVEFNPRDDSIASAGINGEIKLWSANGELAHHFGDRDRPISSISYSPNGKLLASGSQDGTIHLWDTEGQRLKTLRRHQHAISNIQFNAGGNHVASADVNGTVAIWSAQNGNFLFSRSYLGRITDITYGDSDELLIVASTEGKIHVWHYPTDTTVATLNIHRSGYPILLDFDVDETTLLSLGLAGKLNLWNLDMDELMQSSCDLLAEYLAPDEDSSGNSPPPALCQTSG